MVENFVGYYNSPIGWLKVTCSEDTLLSVGFVKKASEDSPNEVVKNTIKQLQEYFDGSRHSFDVVFELNGTKFQEKAWRELMEIPYGKTISYKEQAAKSGRPTASRAIGGANNKNKIAIIIPCHRVIGSRGSLTGYAAGLDKKNWLIEHEKKVLNEKF